MPAPGGAREAFGKEAIVMAVRTETATRLGASAIWAAAAAACAMAVATGPEAAIAHAGWCLSGDGPGLAGLATLAHCPWCYGAIGAALAAIGFAGSALKAQGLVVGGEGLEPPTLSV